MIQEKTFLPGCKVSGPVFVGGAGVREEIIRFDWPRGDLLVLAECFEVARGRRIDDIDLRRHGVDVLDELVHVLVPGVGRHIVEIHPHGEHDVVGSEMGGLEQKFK